MSTSCTTTPSSVSSESLNAARDITSPTITPSPSVSTSSSTYQPYQNSPTISPSPSVSSPSSPYQPYQTSPTISSPPSSAASVTTTNTVTTSYSSSAQPTTISETPPAQPTTTSETSPAQSGSTSTQPTSDTRSVDTTTQPPVSTTAPTTTTNSAQQVLSSTTFPLSNSLPTATSTSIQSPSPILSISSSSMVASPTPTLNTTNPLIIPFATFQMAYASNVSWRVTEALWTGLQPADSSGSAGSLDSKGRFLMTSGDEHISIFEDSKWHLIGTDKKLNAKGQVITSCSNNVWFFGSGEGYVVNEAQLNIMSLNNLTLPQPKKSDFTVEDGYAVSTTPYEASYNVIRTTPGSKGNIDIQQFSVQNYEWTTLNTTGIEISQREGHCLVPNVDGSKFYLFGGQANISHTGTKVYGDLFELNLETLEWEQLPSSVQPRTLMACAASQNAFVVWGGRTSSSGNITLAGQTPAVFDFQSNAWSDFFRGTDDPWSHNDDVKPDGPNLGLIIGLVAGGLTLLAIGVASFLVYSYKRRKARSSGRFGSRPGSINSARSDFGLIDGEKSYRDSMDADSTLDLEVKESEMLSNGPQFVGPNSIDYSDLDSELDKLTDVQYL
ncbi:hypothetical protein BGZ76_004151 [Entomortierella beljakovae]|nr:hypothetical protein BGZ76_004151 [Entomortierella beljakovae]